MNTDRFAVAAAALVVFASVWAALITLSYTGIAIAAMSGLSVLLIGNSQELRGIHLGASLGRQIGLRIILSAFAIVMLVLPPTFVTRSIAALLSFTLIGYSLVRRIHPEEGSIMGTSFLFRMLSSLLLGWALYGLCLLPLALVYLLNALTATFLLIGLVGLGVIDALNLPRGTDFFKESYVVFDLGAAAVTLVGVAVALYLRAFSSWPQIPGFDIYSDMYLVNYVRYFGGISSLLVPYPTTLHIGLAGLSWLLPISVFNIFWYGIFITLPLFALTVYYLYRSMGVSSSVSALGTVISSLVCGFAQSLGPNYVVPSTIGVIFTVSAITFIRASKPSKWLLVGLSSFFAYSTLAYYYSPAVLMPVAYYVLYEKQSVIRKYLPRPPIALAAGGILIVLGVYVTSLGLGPETVPRLPFLENAYTAIGLVALVGTILGVILYGHLETSPLNWSFVRYSAAYVGVLLLILLIPNTVSIRLELYVRIFAGLLIALPLELLLIRKLNWMKVFAIGVVALFLIQPFPFPYTIELSHYAGNGGYTNISKAEFDGVQWLQSNTGLQNGVITDPATAEMIEGIAFRYASDQNRALLSNVMDYLEYTSGQGNMTLTLGPSSPSGTLNLNYREVNTTWTLTGVPPVLTENNLTTGEWKLYGTYEIAQTFILNASTVSSAFIRAREVGNIPASTLIDLQLFPAINGTPVGSQAIASGSMPTSMLTDGYEDYELKLTNASLVASTYIILLTLSESVGDSSDYVGIAADAADVYSGGSAYIGSTASAGWISSGGTMFFQIIGQPGSLVNPVLSVGNTTWTYSGIVGPYQVLQILPGGNMTLDGIPVQTRTTGDIPVLSYGLNVIGFKDDLGATASLTVEWTTPDSSQILQQLDSRIRNDTGGVVQSYEYVFVSGRTSQWVASGNPSSLLFSPQESTIAFPGLAKFSNPLEYSLVFSEGSVSIYRILSIDISSDVASPNPS